MSTRAEAPHPLRWLPAQLRGTPHHLVGDVAVFCERVETARRVSLIAGPRLRTMEMGYLRLPEGHVYYVKRELVSAEGTYRPEKGITGPRLKVRKYTSKELRAIEGGKVPRTVSVVKERLLLGVDLNGRGCGPLVAF